MKSDKLAQLRQSIRDAKFTQAERRSRCIRIYLTSEEEKQVLDSCQGIAASIYCRTKVLGQSVPRPRRKIPEINRQYYIEFRMLSTNLNQIAKGINQAIKAGQKLPLTEQYLSQLQDIQQVLRLHYLELMRLANDYESSEVRGDYDASW